MKNNLLKIKNNIEELKFYLPVLLILPPLFGGIWQLLELSTMSMSYIRFFSATQLLPDGLLILIMIIIFLIIYKLVHLNKKYKLNFNREIIIVRTKKPEKPVQHFNIKKISSNKLTYQKNPIYEKSIFFEIFFIFVFIGAIWLITNYFIIENEEDFSIIVFFIWLALLIAFARIIFQSSIILLVHFIESKSFIIIKDFLTKHELIGYTLKHVAGSVIIILIGILIVLIIKVLIFFHSHYMFPDNLTNKSHIYSYFKDNNLSSIRYINDKYIFIEHVQADKNTSIEVIKFDELFNQKK